MKRPDAFYFPSSSGLNVHTAPWISSACTCRKFEYNPPMELSEFSPAFPSAACWGKAPECMPRTVSSARLFPGSHTTCLCLHQESFLTSFVTRGQYRTTGPPSHHSRAPLLLTCLLLHTSGSSLFSRSRRLLCSVALCRVLSDLKRL